MGTGRGGSRGQNLGDSAFIRQEERSGKARGTALLRCIQQVLTELLPRATVQETLEKPRHLGPVSFPGLSPASGADGQRDCKWEVRGIPEERWDSGKEVLAIFLTPLPPVVVSKATRMHVYLPMLTSGEIDIAATQG